MYKTLQSHLLHSPRVSVYKVAELQSRSVERLEDKLLRVITNSSSECQITMAQSLGSPALRVFKSLITELHLRTQESVSNSLEP